MHKTEMEEENSVGRQLGAETTEPAQYQCPFYYYFMKCE